jgi:hypothetical protein
MDPRKPGMAQSGVLRAWGVALVLGIGGVAVVVCELSGRAGAIGAVLGVALVYGLVEWEHRQRRQ